ncbi:hypothetical protein [Tenggerimyces flavus]|uniref:DUF4340 domain-containing protein n=1 Tax=Tenggerimyces flavus TaxID=1708749 RepID=A0ABV7Y3Q8_9ACTN|nr:hypothetical protein [Tenggerimyces flavus]MBM7788544.1 hypothetical protein [Tenggerimyces flavus]
MTTPVENDLRAELARRADTVPVRSDPYGLVTARVATSRRRRLIATAVTAALVLLAGILSAPVVTKLTGPDVSPVESPATWPARGELADDPGVRAYLSRLYKDDAEDLQILFAGDVADRRYVIVRSVGDPAILALISPAGTYADKPSGGIVNGVPGQTAWAFVDRRKADGPTTVFLVAAPGMETAEYSAAPIVDEDGRMVRDWERMEREDDGVFLAQSRSDPSWLFRTRAAKDGQVEVDVDADFPMSRAPVPSARLMALAADAAPEQDLPKLADALLQLERQHLGVGAITTVSVRWRDQKTPTDLYAGIALDVTGGGSVELVVKDDGNFFEARPVARGQAWKQTPAPGTYPRDAPKPSDVLDVPSTVGERLR